MKQDKLHELFPNLDQETIQEIFSAHDYNLQDTVEILKNSLPIEMSEKIIMNGDTLIAKVKEEVQKINSEQWNDDRWKKANKVRRFEKLFFIKKKSFLLKKGNIFRTKNK